MPAPVAELTHVEMGYRGRRVLGPLSLTVNAGDVVGIVGPNGAGKSTLLRILAGLEHPTHGEVSLFGGPALRRWAWPWQVAPWRRRIGLLLQHHDFHADLPFSARDVVTFGTLRWPQALWPFGRERCRAAVDAALDELGITALADCLYRELSGGERQKVQMARVLAQEAELILLDEPTSGLDLEWQERVTQLVACLRRDYGRTVVMVTHDVDRLPGNCTTVVLMRAGRSPRVGSPTELLAAEPLSEVYACPVKVIWSGTRRRAFAAFGSTDP